MNMLLPKNRPKQQSILDTTKERFSRIGFRTSTVGRRKAVSENKYQGN